MNIDGSSNPNDRSPKVDESAVSLKPGTLISKKCEVSSCIGSGGMGTVYLVKQIFLGKHFALKLLEKQHHTEVSVRRFHLEARTTAQLRHPNLVEVHDFGVYENDQPFLVMDFVQGHTLSEILKRSGTLPVDYVIALALEISQGLNYAHSQGVVHRDIKPSNIMIQNSGEKPSTGTVKILDFGIAKLSQPENGQIEALTKTGEIFGSPIYMSPEQCQGTMVDRRADIYSLGCVLFECLTGTPPFLGDNAMTTMLKRITDQPPTLKEASLGLEFPKELEAIVRKMLEVDANNRYPDLDPVIKDLRQMQPERDSSRDTAPSQSEIPTLTRRNTFNQKNFAIVAITAILSTAAMAAIDRQVIFKAEFVADKMYRAEQKKQAEIADKNSAQKVFVDYKERLRYPTREFVGQGVAKRELLRFPNRCGKISFAAEKGLYPAYGAFFPDGKLVNLFLDEDAAADPAILQNFLDVNFGIISFKNYRISNETLVMIGKLKHIEELDVDGGNISSLEPIYDQKLYALDVGETRLSATEILKLNHLKEIKNITFGPLDNPAAVISELIKGKQCRNFYYKGALPADNEAMRWRDLTARDVDLIVQIPGLQYVAFQNCPQFDDACLSKLTALKSLIGLTVKECSLTPQALKILKKMKELKELRITATGWPASAVAEFSTLPIKDKKIVASQSMKNKRSYKKYLDVAKTFDLKDPALDP